VIRVSVYSCLRPANNSRPIVPIAKSFSARFCSYHSLSSDTSNYNFEGALKRPDIDNNWDMGGQKHLCYFPSHSMSFNPAFAEAQNLSISGGSFHQNNIQLSSHWAEPGVRCRILIASDP